MIFPQAGFLGVVLSIPPPAVIPPLPRASLCGKSPGEVAAPAMLCFALGSVLIQSISEASFPSCFPHTGLSSLPWMSHHLRMLAHTHSTLAAGGNPWLCARWWSLNTLCRIDIHSAGSLTPSSPSRHCPLFRWCRLHKGPGLCKGTVPV